MYILCHLIVDNIQRINASKKTPNQYNRPAFEEVEFSRPNKDHSKESQRLIQNHGDWSSHNRNVPGQPLSTKSQLSEENVIVINQDEEITNRNEKVNIVCDDNRASTSYNTQDVQVLNITSDTIDNNNEPATNNGVNNNTAISRHQMDRQMTESSHSNYNRQNTNSTNNNNNRHADREDTCDDFGYHSDYSKSIKPDTESNLLSTFRSSNLQSNGTNARSLTSYDVYDDAIETYNDDGESIDWN